MAPVDFTGNWIEVKKEGFGDLFKSMGIPEEMRKKFEAFKIRHVIAQDGNTMEMKVTMPTFEQEMTLVVDGTEQEFDDMLTHTKAKVVARWEGDKMVADVENGGKKSHMERYMDGDQMVATATVEGMLATLYMVKS